MESLLNSNSYAIQDDYSFWHLNKGAADSGKLFLVDETDENIHQIFFDDNINDNLECSIVDIRSASTGKKIEYRNAIGKYMVKVESDKVILDEDYFIKKLYECEAKKLQEKILNTRKKSNEIEFLCLKNADTYLNLPRCKKVNTNSCRCKDSMETPGLLCLFNQKLTQFDGDFLIKDVIINEEPKFIK